MSVSLGELKVIKNAGRFGYKKNLTRLACTIGQVVQKLIIFIDVDYTAVVL